MTSWSSRWPKRWFRWDAEHSWRAAVLAGALHGLVTGLVAGLLLWVVGGQATTQAASGLAAWMGIASMLHERFGRNLGALSLRDPRRCAATYAAGLVIFMLPCGLAVVGSVMPRAIPTAMPLTGTLMGFALVRGMRTRAGLGGWPL